MHSGTESEPESRGARCAGIAAGIGVHLFFAFTVWHLYGFLKGGLDATESRATAWALCVDAVLALQFAIPHSLLLHPAIRERLTRWIPSQFYGLLFCAATCAGLLVTIGGWRTMPDVWWNVPGTWRHVVHGGFLASWVGLLYSISLTGFGYQTGWTPWWHWVRRRPIPPRPFAPRSVYRYLRHPVYLSFLGLVWFTPVMTADRAVLTAIWTAYLFVGSYLKDERLAYYLGDRYRAYQAEVPGYPGMLLGPLARVPIEPVHSETPEIVVARPESRRAA